MSISYIALVLALIVLVNGDSPVSLQRELDTIALTSELNRNDEQVYRLPESVIPLEYEIFIDLYFAERTDRPFSFDGRENIVIQAVEDNVSNIVLHANVDRINAISVLNSNGAPVALNLFEPFTIQPQYHFLTINLGETLVKGSTYTLFIDYSNTMNVGPMKRGIWRGYYTDDAGIERIYATTHFQPYNARQAFPCWDEPLFKATFKVHLSSPANYNSVFSNTKIGNIESLSNNRIRTNFMETPKMSSYLVTFLVSETFTVIAEDTSFTPPIRIIGRSNTVGLGDHALNLAVKMTTFFDDYFEVSYGTMHPNLLNDHISSPDWASAGTENWGMVSYRELYLTLNSSESIMSNQHYAGTLVSHELAHKWFGNLITCFWWSNTWINEGFASYFGYIATNQMFPEYEYEDHFNSRYLQNSISFDSSSTVALNHEVNTPAQVTGHFGTVSYSKGAAFLRMIHDMITPATFRKACRIFLTSNSYEPTDQYDLYKAFEEAIQEDGTLNEYQGFSFEDFYRIWVNEPGTPILLVEINHETGAISLKQERFFLSPTASPTGQIYPIPITYSTKSNPQFGSLKPIQMMSGETLSLTKVAGEEWVIFNNLQHGHYRVDYDAKSWSLIAEALLNEPESIHYLNRAQVVDDVFALMRSTRMTYSFGFNILRFLRNEHNMHVWDAAISGFTWLRNRLRHLPESQAEFDAFILDTMSHLLEHVGFNVLSTDTPTDIMNRQAALHFACLLGHEQCVTESRNQFLRFKDHNVWVHGGIRRNVYVVGVREGDEQDFNFILSRLRSSNLAHDQLEMLRAMGAAKNPALLTRYLELTLTNEVRSHDKANSFNYALLGNKENAPTVLQFVKNNIDAMRVAYVEDAPPNPVHTCLSNLASYLEEPELVEYEEWLRSTQVGTLQYNTALSAITSARNNMAWGTDNVDNILGAIRDDATRVVTSVFMLGAMALLAVIA
ncbi:membrane alanyl aminopeptidase-like [Leguminivora glycinivorella]|uniref:membrane alanyl aminopeptidase-like n=1 Tax=Leguminivora glycinivorella TaxID=1035111 RepID=UPI00200E43E5|nr:membrane alanyl aminopeptidase-like [Leguminivora glycinivorella]